MAKVSIIIPVHNTERYLRQCVDSVLRQTLKDIEIILVENGSDDNSPKLCRELASEDARIKVVILEKGDLPAARNAGVMMASSDFVGFVDSDDMIAPDMYGRMYDAAVREGADIVNCNYVKIYNNGRRPKYQYCEDDRETVLSPKEMISLNMKEAISQSACTLLVRRAILLARPFDEGVKFEDRRITFMFYAMAGRCVRINKSLYYYYQYRGGIVRKGRRVFRINYDFATADRIRLDFIRNSGMFSPSEQTELAPKSAESFLRKLNRMRREISCREDRAMLREIMKSAELIPDGCRLSLKARIILFVVRKLLKK